MPTQAPQPSFSRNAASSACCAALNRARGASNALDRSVSPRVIALRGGEGRQGLLTIVIEIAAGGSLRGDLDFVVPPSSAQGRQQAGAVDELLYSSIAIAEPCLCVGPFCHDQVQRGGCTH